MSQDSFADRHIGPTDKETEEMLRVVGVKDIPELIGQVVPAGIRLEAPPELTAAMSESEFAAHVGEIAARNQPFRTFIGMGYYPTATPAAIVRNILENPVWYTSYTPYQAEISQGRLEALLNFQTMVAGLTGLPVSNCSLLDEGTAAAEAMTMMFNQRSRTAVKANRRILFVDENIFPQTLDVILTRAEPLGIEVLCDDYASYEFSGQEFGTILSYPAADGAVRDYREFCERAHSEEVPVAAVCDLMALALFTPPGEWGADIAVGSTQRFGIPMGFGGPSAAYLAARDEYKRNIPGRIIGVSVDRLGNRALRMALQTREQHIKRERATSNICTAQALLATLAGMYAVYHGPEGIRRIARHIHVCTRAVAEAAKTLGYEIKTAVTFDTLRLSGDAPKIRSLAEEAGINLWYPNDHTVQFSLDELTTHREVQALADLLAAAAGKEPVEVRIEDPTPECRTLARQSPYLTEEVFNRYHSETELMRYIHKLGRRDISLTHSMIPLGSCTMKLNSASSMMPLTLPGFSGVHPFVPDEQAKGYRKLITELSRALGALTGFPAVSLQPNSGAAGEYAGLMVIRAYHLYRGDEKRHVALIPASAHGTNPASAVMAGMKTVVVRCDANGNIDVDDLRAKAEQYRETLSCVMITYPSTHGVFEGRVREMVDIVHANGGLVYMDGANMNAQVGLTHPGAIGADVCHLNLHKTFGSPHGGGGPGVGPIGVAAHLARFLPSHAVVPTGGADGITAVSSSPFGSAWILPITYAYIRMLGTAGLQKSTEMAIVNANYLASALGQEFGIVYTGETGRVGHELILDLREYRKTYGVEAADIARRLMDYGFHAPTLSFPVPETLMVEPTESESKAELDRFVEAMVSIKRECEAIREGVFSPEDNPVKMAPHTAAEVTADEWNHGYTRSQAAYPLPWVRENKFWPYVTKIDAGYGDRNLVCTWERPETK